MDPKVHSRPPRPGPSPLLEASYDELRALARAYLRDQSAGHTLQPTALVHEAWLRLAKRAAEAEPGSSASAPPTREQFLAAAARTMRRILINHAERRGAQKRGGAARRVGLDEALETLSASCGDALQFDEALARLARVDGRQASIVELRIFLGFTLEETAEALEVSPRTVEREWRMARAWLRQQIGG